MNKNISVGRVDHDKKTASVEHEKLHAAIIVIWSHLPLSPMTFVPLGGRKKMTQYDGQGIQPFTVSNCQFSWIR